MSTPSEWTVLIPADEPVRRPPVRALPEPGGKPAAVYTFASCGTATGAAQHEKLGERPCRRCAEVQP